MLKKQKTDYDKMRSDFYEVIDKINSGAGDKWANLRCHETAYLAAMGMKQKGYVAELKKGIYFDFLNNTDHSWIKVDGAILSYFTCRKVWAKRFTVLDETDVLMGGSPKEIAYVSHFSENLGETRIDAKWWEKARYIEFPIKIKLSGWVEELGKQLFS